LELITKRVKRANGQLAAVVRMLEEGRNCEEVVTQMSAVAKAVNTAAFTLISASLKECLIDDKSNSEAVTAQLQKLFLSLA
jgi:DNA-binding FrmR family transcriptional regulator